MMLKDLALKNRSYRRFQQDYKIEEKTLRALVDLARLSASSANLQPLKYLLSSGPEKNAKIFPLLAWAGYLKGWGGPKEGERPSAYIIMVGDTEISKKFEYDAGIAAQSILLGATEKGLGGCMIATIKKDALRQLLNIPEHLEIVLVIAIGKPKEKIMLNKIKNKGIKYWRDKDGTHHVPKRSLDEIIISC